MNSHFLSRDEADESNDGQRVALIKSLATNNRFYVLVPGDSGINNADTIEEIPHELLLGIAYPCLEDGLNDFAVIRTSYETLELFPNDEEMRRELMEMIEDARRNLIWRLMELLERIIAQKAYFLGADLQQLKTSALNLMNRGFPRRDLDSMMKVNIFSSVEIAARAAWDFDPGEQAQSDIYRYEFHNSENLARLTDLAPREFLLSLFSDVLDSVLDDRNYESKYTFDRHVFQQFIAMMFISYASTDPVFYGTHKDDYGVSGSKSMDETPLYRAIKREMRRIADKSSAYWPQTTPETSESAKTQNPETSAKDANPLEPPSQVQSALDEPPVQLPSLLANEDLLLRPIASIRALALQLQKHRQNDTAELSQLILAEATRLVEELKRLGMISPLAYNPGPDEKRPRGGSADSL